MQSLHIRQLMATIKRKASAPLLGSHMSIQPQMMNKDSVAMLWSHRQPYSVHSGVSGPASRNKHSRLSALEKELLEQKRSAFRVRKDKRSLTILYRALQIQLRAFPDPVCSNILRGLLRSRYNDKVSNSSDPNRDQVNAKKWLIILQKANVGDLNALSKVVEIAYGQRGSLRHRYLDRLANQVTVPKAELIPGYSRSRPPSTSEKLAALWSLQFPSTKTTLVLPKSAGGQHGKPLDRRREANLRWRHHTDLLAKTMPPIPPQHLDSLRRVVNGTAQLRLHGVPDWRRSTLAEMKERAENKSTTPHTINQRLLRRLFLPVLAKSPVLYQKPSGHWAAHYVQVDKLLSHTTEDEAHNEGIS